MKIRGESVLNFILLIGGLAMMGFAFQMGFGSFRRPGSGLFPFFCGLIIFLANSVLLAKRPKQIPPVFQRQEIMRMMGMSVPFLCWILLMPLFGYIVMTFVSTLLLAKVLRLEGWRKPLILSLLTTGVCYLLFGYYLVLDLPRGIFHF